MKKIRTRWISTTYKKTIKKFSIKLWRNFSIEIRIAQTKLNPNLNLKKCKHKKIGSLYGVKFYTTNNESKESKKTS